MSRAFSRPQLLRQQTVSHVMAVAASLGYVRNDAARALSTGRFSSIAVVVPDIANPFFPPLLRRIQAGADRAGYAVLLGDSDESAVREALLVSRLSTQVEGFVLASSRMSAELVRSSALVRPVVLINRDIEGIPRVLVDSSGGITEAVMHLAQLGHRRVGYLAGPKDSWSDGQRRSLLLQAAEQSGVHVELLELGRPSHDAGRNAVPWLTGSQLTAAIAFDDVVAQGVLAGLAVRGISVPNEFSVVGCDDILAATTHPPLTTISAGAADAGETAVRLLMEILANRSQAAERQTLPTHLVVRATTDLAH